MDGARERVLDGHNTVLRFPSRYRIENILERSSREKSRRRRKQIDAGILAVGAAGSLIGGIVDLCHGGVIIPKVSLTTDVRLADPQRYVVWENAKHGTAIGGRDRCNR